jgi:hypothetical protein
MIEGAMQRIIGIGASVLLACGLVREAMAQDCGDLISGSQPAR